MFYYAEQKILLKNNALMSDLSTLGKILSPSKLLSWMTKVWGRLPMPVILNSVIYVLYALIYFLFFLIVSIFV